MGQKDLAQNDYLNDNVRFADMCNGIIFQGERWQICAKHGMIIRKMELKKA